MAQQGAGLQRDVLGGEGVLKDLGPGVEAVRGRRRDPDPLEDRVGIIE